MYFFTLLLFASLCTSVMQAASFVYEDVSYEPTSATTCKVVAGTGAYASDLIIPAVAKDGNKEYSVTGIGTNAFNKCATMTSVILPSSLQYIENGAFFKTTKLKSITSLATTPPDIVSSPFATTTYINCKLIVPAGCWLQYQREWSRMTNVIEEGCGQEFAADGFNYTILSEANRQIRLRAGSPAYSGAVTLPETVEYDGKRYAITEIGFRAFYGCASVSSVTMPVSVRVIGQDCFKNCAAMTQLNLNDSITVAGNGFLYGCVSLESIHLPAALTCLQGTSLQGCTKITSLVLPDALRELGPSALRNCSSLQIVTGAPSLKYIRSGAFMDCIALKTFDIPVTVDSIENSAFTNCHALENVNLPQGITKLDSKTFMNCSSLRSIVVPESVNYLGASVFDGCTALEIAKLPERLLTYLQLGDTMSRFGLAMFQNCHNLRRVTLPKNLRSIPNNTFFHCYKLEQIDLPDSIHTIGNFAFSNCTTLQAINLPNSLTGLALGSFLGCTGLKSITVPSSVTKMGTHVFQDCAGLNSVKLDANVTAISQSTFIDCTSLREVTLPGTVTEIKNTVFKNCIALQEITLPDSLKKIDKGVFMACASLRSISLPQTVQTIADSVFSGCNALVNIRCNTTTPPSVLPTSFDEYTYTHATLEVPNDALAEYKTDTTWGRFLNIADAIVVNDDMIYQIYVCDRHIVAPEGTVIYDIRGMRKNNNCLAPGIYIAVMPDNTAVKISVNR